MSWTGRGQNAKYGGMCCHDNSEDRGGYGTNQVAGHDRGVTEGLAMNREDTT